MRDLTEKEFFIILKVVKELNEELATLSELKNIVNNSFYLNVDTDCDIIMIGFLGNMIFDSQEDLEEVEEINHESFKEFIMEQIKVSFSEITNLSKEFLKQNK